MSFKVSETGVPVLVKVSYFPNWKVEGATGPWRATPNLMVVLPTEEKVVLTYGRTGIDLFSIFLSLIGLVLLLLLRFRPEIEIEDIKSSRADELLGKWTQRTKKEALSDDSESSI